MAANWTFKVVDQSKVKKLHEFKTWNLSTKEAANINPDSLGIFLGGGWSAHSNIPKPEINYNINQ